MADKKADEVQREERRKIIAANLLAGLNYRDIVAAFEKRGESLSISTISRDVKLILGRLHREQVQEARDWVTIECRRLDTALNAIWDKVQNGQLNAIDRMIAIMNRRSRYLGLDEPTEFRLSDDELLAEYNGLLKQLAQLEQEKTAGETGGDSSQDAQAGNGDAESETTGPGAASAEAEQHEN